MTDISKAFKIRHGLEATTATLGTLVFSSDGLPITSKADILGYTGSAGTNGTNGDPGATGYTGSQGSAGDPGATGYTGSAGTNGTTGYTGSQGDAGSAGATGATGYTGSSGNPFTGGTFTDTITTKGVNETVYNWGNVAAGTYTPNVSSGTVHKMTLTGNVTISSLANATTGSNCSLIITQDATGSRLLTSTMKFQGGNNILSTAGTSTDIMSIFYDGTTYWAGLGKGYA